MAVILKNDSLRAPEEQPEKPRAVLVSILTDADTAEDVDESMDELARLLDTAGGTVAARMVQSRSAPDARTLIGSGKVRELADMCRNLEASLVVFDCDLTPVQIRNMEDDIGIEDLRVIDRSMLILDIFALHAVTAEGKLQVELAQLKYTAPRLLGKGSELSRLGGGIGTRGPGESKLETDRRHLQRRVHALEEELRALAENRQTQRRARDRSGLAKVAIVGYTNAGKSTLLNALTGADILAKDQLFATLDPTTRKCTLPGGETVLLTDTVGFIRNLPHHLVHAFRSTLEEATYADLLLILIDGSDPEAPAQLAVTEKLLQELGAGEKPTIHVYNKCDLGVSMPGIGRAGENNIYISAATGQGVDRLLLRMEELLHAGKRRVTFRIPNAKHGLVTKLYENATVENVEYGAEAVDVTAVVDAKTYGALREYDTAPLPETEDE